MLEKNIVLKSIPCFKEFKELIAQRNLKEHYIIFSLEEFNGRKADNLFVWKLIGLTITDGDLSSILKSKRIKNITFRGLTLETAYSVFSTSLHSLGKAKVYGFKQNILGHKRHYYIVKVLPFKSNDKCVRILSQNLFSLLEESNKNVKHRLEMLNVDVKAALLAGLLDGDGYIGNKSGYVMLSYNKDTRKGKLIRLILETLEKSRFIILGKYRGKPHYEQYFRFSHMKFLENTVKLMSHPRRKIRLLQYYKNIRKNYECEIDEEELIFLLRIARSAYIDHRFKEKRNSSVLIVYIDPKYKNNIKSVKIIMSGKRGLVKIGSKCKEKLRKIFEKNTVRIEDKVKEKIREYIVAS